MQVRGIAIVVWEKFFVSSLMGMMLTLVAWSGSLGKFEFARVQQNIDGQTFVGELIWRVSIYFSEFRKSP